jgi:uncharacterized protein YggE
MTRPMRLLASVVLLAGGIAAAEERVIQPPLSQVPPHPSQSRTIRVGGEGRASAPPDVAVVTVGIEAIGKDLARTRADADARMRQVLATVKAAGVDPKDVQTVRYDVAIERPWKDGKPGPITGYHVSNLARVKVRVLAKLGDVLDRVGAAGSNAIQGLAFEREDMGAEKARALADAVKDARGKAEALAKAAGVSLGELQSITESVQGPQPFPMRMELAQRSSGAPVETGEVEVRAAVELVLAIK